MIPANTAALIERFEGLVKVGADGLVYPYLDCIGIPTIGIGTLVKDVKEATPLTPERCREYLTAHLERLLPQVLGLAPVLAAHPDKLAAVLSWTYNLGIGNLQASTMLRRINARDWSGAAAECQKWDKAGGRVWPGLMRRRKAEAQLIGG